MKWGQGKRKTAGDCEPAVEAPIPTPVTQQDRDYLQMMYEEHAEEARQHETLRGVATTLFVSLIAGILTLVGSGLDKGQFLWPSGVSICLLSAIGAILNRKHYERNRLHATVLAAFRQSLEQGLTPGLDKINCGARQEHEKEWPITSSLRLYRLWEVIYAVSGALGIAFVIKALHWNS